MLQSCSPGHWGAPSQTTRPGRVLGGSRGVAGRSLSQSSPGWVSNGSAFSMGCNTFGCHLLPQFAKNHNLPLLDKNNHTVLQCSCKGCNAFSPGKSNIHHQRHSRVHACPPPVCPSYAPAPCVHSQPAEESLCSSCMHNIRFLLHLPTTY